MKKVAIILTVGLFLLVGCRQKQSTDFATLETLYTEYLGCDSVLNQLISISYNTLNAADIDYKDKRQILKDDLNEIVVLNDIRFARLQELKTAVKGCTFKDRVNHCGKIRAIKKATKSKKTDERFNAYCGHVQKWIDKIHPVS